MFIKEAYLTKFYHRPDYERFKFIAHNLSSFLKSYPILKWAEKTIVKSLLYKHMKTTVENNLKIEKCLLKKKIRAIEKARRAIKNKL